MTENKLTVSFGPLRRYRHASRWRVLMGTIYNTPIRKNVVIAEVKTVVYHSSYLPFVDANIDDNSRDIAVLALTKPLQFTGQYSTTRHTKNIFSILHLIRKKFVIATSLLVSCHSKSIFDMLSLEHNRIGSMLFGYQHS